MSTIHLDDAFGDQHRLYDPAEAPASGSIDDEDEVRAILFRLLAEPGPNADWLRRLAFEDVAYGDSLHPSADLHDGAIVDALTTAVMRGQIVLTRHRVLGGGAGSGGDGLPSLDDLAGGDDADETDRPCDYDVLVIRCKHMPDSDPDGKRTLSGARFWKTADGPQNDLPAPPSGRAYVKELEIVAGSDGRAASADPITVVLEGGPGYGCGRTHPHVKVKDKLGVLVETRGETTVTFDGRAGTDGASPSSHFLSAIRQVWFGGSTNMIDVDVEACGKRDGGAPTQGRTLQKIRVYPSELYKLSLDIPALGRRSDTKAGGRTIQDGPGRQDFSERATTREGFQSSETSARRELVDRDADGNITRLESNDRYGVQDRSGSLTETTTRTIDADGIGGGVTLDEGDGTAGLPLRLGGSVSFTRSGKALAAEASLGELIEALATVEQTITDIKRFIQDFQPQVGWKLLFDVELFKGSLSAEWGYKEWTDHTVYEFWAFAIDMTLFQVKLEASFGIEFSVWWVDIVAKVYGSVSVNAKLAASKESSPDDPSPWEAAVVSEPRGELGIRAALGADFVTAGGRIVFGVTFSAKAAISVENFDGIAWRVDREKVEPTLTGRVRWIGSFERKWKWMDGKKNWAHGTFPGQTNA